MTEVPATMLTSIPAVPTSRRDPVVERIHGVEITDSFRWLEDGESAEVKTWTDAQNRRTAAMLEAVPGRAALAERLDALSRIDVVMHPEVRRNRFFYQRRSGTQDQPVLVWRDGLDGDERVLVDPNAIGGDGLTALDWWYPSPSGGLVAYGTSRDGDEWSTLRVARVESDELLPDEIERTRYSSLTWWPDERGFFYTRYPHAGDVPAGDENYYRHLFRHELGTDPTADPKVFGEGRAKEEMLSTFLSPNGRWLVVIADRGLTRSEVYARDLAQDTSDFVPLVVGRDALYHSPHTIDDRLFLVTNDASPNGRVIALDLDVLDGRSPSLDDWATIVPERADWVLESFVLAGGKIVTAEAFRAIAAVRMYGLDGTPEGELTLPGLGEVSALDGSFDQPWVTVGYSSFNTPPSAFVFHTSGGERFPLAPQATPDDLDLTDIAVEQVTYPSRDATQVSMFLVGRSAVLARREGDAPTILAGYGGFNIGKTPGFRASVLAWIERDGLLAVPNLRGGNEYGEAWHRDGMLGNKQNVFDDYIAAAEWLIDQKYTRPERLAVRGRSNGGLLVGAFLTQRPDLCAAVSCGVPLLDMVRYHHFGIARLWIPEYGSAEAPEAFAWLHAYSPYHHVTPGERYPATFIYTAEHDTRVDPLHARKMTALLQTDAANGTQDDRPILLRVETQAGHGVGKPRTKVIEEALDEGCFLAWQLGVSLEPTASLA